MESNSFSKRLSYLSLWVRLVLVVMAFQLIAVKEMRFALGRHYPAYPLTIGSFLRWHTFMGAASSDAGVSAAVDGGGNIYVIGTSDATWGSPLNPHAGNNDAFVAKLNRGGTLLWHTFLGSASNDFGTDVALDGSGNVYVIGLSYATWGSPLIPYAGSTDAFVAKLNSNGTLQWHTFLGSGSGDGCDGIVADSSSYLYVIGTSHATWGSPISPHVGNSDAFAAKLNGNGILQWHTFMGSASWDQGFGIAADNGGNVYVAGHSGATWGTPLNPHVGSNDAFAAKLSSNGVLQWHTFIGSADEDVGTDISLDRNGNAYMAGYSDATWGSPLNPHTGNSDVFVAKLDSSGVFQWHTFIGSASYDTGSRIAVDGADNVYVAGSSDASWGSPLDSYAGGRDAFAVKLNSNGTLEWHTFMGSTSSDSGTGIAVGEGGIVYIVGTSDATWGSPLNPHAGGQDAFLVRRDSVSIYLPMVLKGFTS